MAKLTGALLVAALVAGCASPESGGASAPVPNDLEPFLNAYFESWSQDDMERYRQLFHPQAVVYMTRDGRLSGPQPRDSFVSEQARLRRESVGKLEETMTDFEAQVDEQAASVTAWWDLTRGGQPYKHGVDRFTLMRDESGSWRIVSLLFYR